jgi:hypothetical protein
MDHNFYDNDFEEYLKQKSELYKMYPSDRVWNNINSSLHGRKKWWGLGIFLFFVAGGVLISREMLMPRKATGAIADKTVTTSVTDKSSNKFSPDTKQLTSSSGTNDKTIAANTVHAEAGVQENILIPGRNRVLQTATPGLLSEIGSEEIVPVTEKKLAASLPARNQPAAAKFSINAPAIHATSIAREQVSPVKSLEASLPASASKKSPLSLKFYASPNISYRRLNSMDQAITQVPVASGAAGDVNRYVHHRPAPGFEIGTTVQYDLSGSLSVFAGAQLNYSRYYIAAYKYHTEKASIALDKPFVRDTLSGYTDIRNLSGYAPEQLQNKYLQVAVPVGLEIKLLGNKNLQFKVAGSVQPTFLLTSKVYLLSSDYKNYIEGPNMARTFNVHTNFEAFVSYQTGGLRWQIGPQFRSQLLSSYSNQYRVREYLTEFGLKIGVTKRF